MRDELNIIKTFGEYSIGLGGDGLSLIDREILSAISEMISDKDKPKETEVKKEKSKFLVLI